MKFLATAKGLELLSDFDKNLPEFINGDQVKLNQILTNLIGNAIKFTPNGYIKLSVKMSEEKLKNGKSSLRFSVQDSGIGIPADKLDKIFISFEQSDTSTTRKFGGTGLGLSSCRNIVEQHGGSIYVRNNPTTFTISLPKN